MVILSKPKNFGLKGKTSNPLLTLDALSHQPAIIPDSVLKVLSPTIGF